MIDFSELLSDTIHPYSNISQYIPDHMTVSFYRKNVDCFLSKQAVTLLIGLE